MRAVGGVAMLSEARLAVRLKHRVGTLGLDVSFETSAAWTVLFGASGSGKSTLLRGVAGFFKPEDGRVMVGGRVVVDTVAEVFVPAHLRGVRYAGQTAMLFPHMTVGENLAQAGGDVGRAVRHFGLEGLAGKRPGELSGGQQQMVSVVRAACAAGDVLLLDEPFSGLDGGLRDFLILRLKEWIGETPVVSVTHDVGEAFLLGAEVVRMAEGKVVGQGEVGVVLGEERRRLVGVLGRVRD